MAGNTKMRTNTKIMSLFIQAILIVNAAKFLPEGEESNARLIVKAYEMGWKRFIVYNAHGQRFCGSGLGNHTTGVRIDVYDLNSWLFPPTFRNQFQLTL
jgi:hypothetical protein